MALATIGLSRRFCLQPLWFSCAIRCDGKTRLVDRCALFTPLLAGAGSWVVRAKCTLHGGQKATGRVLPSVHLTVHTPIKGYATPVQ